MIILAIDTSTNHGSVAVLADGALVFEENFSSDRSHSSSLFTCLERARKAASTFDQVAVGLGPGSYAGVRIAIAAAMGLELTLGAKLLGLASIGALETDAGHYVAVGDARRGSFYWTEVKSGVCVMGPELVEEAALRERLAAVAVPVLATEPVAIVPQAQVCLPSAARLARLAAEDKGIVAREQLEPIYLREPHITQPTRNVPPPLRPA